MGKIDGVDETDLLRHSVTEPEGPPEPFSLYSTLPRSMRETKLVTNVKVEEDAGCNSYMDVYMGDVAGGNKFTVAR